MISHIRDVPTGSIGSEQLVHHVLVQYQGVQAPMLRPDAILGADLYLDSLELVDLSLLMEDRYGIVLESSLLRTMETLEDLVIAVEQARQCAGAQSCEAMSAKSASKAWFAAMRKPL
jgi:acyl carrier protein